MQENNRSINGNARPEVSGKYPDSSSWKSV